MYRLPCKVQTVSWIVNDDPLERPADVNPEGFKWPDSFSRHHFIQTVPAAPKLFIPTAGVKRR